MNALGVVAALESEGRTLGAAVRRRDGLSSLGDGALLAVSGMGGALAAIAARSLADAGAERLLSFGMAGGLDPKLTAGTVVLPTEVISLSGTRFATSAQWREQLSLAVAAARPPADGALLSSATPVDAVADKAALFYETGAVAVDMESLGVAEVAAARGLPFMAVRVIVDTAGDVLPRAVVAASQTGQVNLRRLVGGLALAPLELVAVIRLARRYRAALRSLSAVARVGLSAPQLAGARVA
ncbi:MAG: purine and other phosphorylase-like protein, family 1 [Gammaproteobacteria bacterium]